VSLRQTHRSTVLHQPAGMQPAYCMYNDKEAIKYSEQNAADMTEGVRLALFAWVSRNTSTICGQRERDDTQSTE